MSLGFHGSLALLCLVAVLLNLWTAMLLQSQRVPAATRIVKDSGRHPAYLVDSNLTTKVALSPEDTVHYALGTPEALARWDRNSTGDPHNWLVLPPRMHAYVPAMAHELHCLAAFHASLSSPSATATFGHFDHCLSYLRQMILCDPDLTLENVNAMEDGQHYGTHVCKDWSAFWRVSESLSETECEGIMGLNLTNDRISLFWTVM